MPGEWCIKSHRDSAHLKHGTEGLRLTWRSVSEGVFAYVDVYLASVVML